MGTITLVTEDGLVPTIVPGLGAKATPFDDGSCIVGRGTFTRIIGRAPACKPGITEMNASGLCFIRIA